MQIRPLFVAVLTIAVIVLMCGFYKHGYQTGIGHGFCYTRAGKLEVIRRHYLVPRPAADPLEDRCRDCNEGLGGERSIQ
jgi:hypothetical protein